MLGPGYKEKMSVPPLPEQTELENNIHHYISFSLRRTIRTIYDIDVSMDYI